MITVLICPYCKKNVEFEAGIESRQCPSCGEVVVDPDSSIGKRNQWANRAINLVIILLIAWIGYEGFKLFTGSKNSSVNSYMAYDDYKDCKIDTAKWRLVYNDLIDEATKDYKDGVWDSEPNYNGWEGKLSEIDKYASETIANQDILGQIGVIRKESFERVVRIHKLTFNDQMAIAQKFGLEYN